MDLAMMNPFPGDLGLVVVLPSPSGGPVGQYSVVGGASQECVSGGPVAPRDVYRVVSGSIDRILARAACALRT
jgi:hypothetical protein